MVHVRNVQSLRRWMMLLGLLTVLGSLVVAVERAAAEFLVPEKDELTLEILGHQGLGWEGHDFQEHELAAVRGWLSAKAMSIYGGSFEIQNNIIAKNILGLPENTQRG